MAAQRLTGRPACWRALLLALLALVRGSEVRPLAAPYAHWPEKCTLDGVYHKKATKVVPVELQPKCPQHCR